MGYYKAYDSGTATYLEANRWLRWQPSPSISPRPFGIHLAMIPKSAPLPGWNLAGYAFVELNPSGNPVACGQTVIPNARNWPTPIYAALSFDGAYRDSGLRHWDVFAVQFNANRWLGEYQVVIWVSN